MFLYKVFGRVTKRMLSGRSPRVSKGGVFTLAHARASAFRASFLIHKDFVSRSKPENFNTL